MYGKRIPESAPGEWAGEYTGELMFRLALACD